MPSTKFLHQHSQFAALLQIVATGKSIDPALIEKDYWIMHCLYGLQQMDLAFELKGGTSLSKGYRIIHRFSEDIDIRIEPPAELRVKTGKNHDKPAHREGRRNFYDWLAKTIEIDGIEAVRDTDFDDKEKFRNGGIRLLYKSTTIALPGLKEGVLLEVGFDDVTPNWPQDISSWAFDYAETQVSVLDNRARAVACYHPGYTLVEKLQTISTKYRQQQRAGSPPVNFLRHYYDVYCLLQDSTVLPFIGTPEYFAHKEKRFRSEDNPVIAENEAFLLSDSATRSQFERDYQKTRALYYQNQPDFGEILNLIQKYTIRL